jgi:hypothetical protein
MMRAAKIPTNLRNMFWRKAFQTPKNGLESYFAFPGIVVVVEIITTVVIGMSKIVAVVLE